MGRPAIFLDRDGTLVEEVGYLNHVSRLRVFPFGVEAIRRVNASGRLAVVATNQPGVAHGYFPERVVHQINDAMRAELAAGGARLDGLYVCLHHPTSGEPPYRLDCECRKPKPGLLRQAAEELDIDLARSWMIGDRPKDLEVAWRVGARGALVRTGYGLGELEHNRSSWSRQPDLVADHLLEAVDRILSMDARA